MKQILLFLICSLLSIKTTAQITFPITDLPQQAGYRYRAYVGATVSVSGLLGQPGGPQQWNFSQPQTGGEVVERMDIVSATDGGNSAFVPQATYADRLTNESNGEKSWTYYTVNTNQGRLCYGFVDTNSNPDFPVKTFYSPTVDLPASVYFGQTWSRSVTFNDFAVFIDFVVHFTADASVDAYGTILLPGIGSVPALRVNEVHTYRYQDITLGILNYTNYFRDYYWLVPSIGKAVDIISQSSQTGPPVTNFATAGSFLRVFESSTAGPHPVAGLRIQPLSSLTIILDWQSDTNATGYRVEVAGTLATNGWQTLAEPTSNSWVEAFMPAVSQRFFKVSTKP